MSEKKRKKTQIVTNHKTFMKTYIVQPTKHQLQHNMNGQVNFRITKKPLNDEIKLQIDENINRK